VLRRRHDAVDAAPDRGAPVVGSAGGAHHRAEVGAMIAALYNEIEPFAADWLLNLSDAGHIARGSVDVRSIRDLRADDLVGVRQFHTFAGLGAWSYALRLAGWPDDRHVWTGSCPCQPFSDAGDGAGFDDPRHLWPEWFRLIRECGPPVVFGEQVASRAGLAWLDVVRADLEGAGYAVGAADLCAAGVGAPHIRQRLFFGAVRLADADPRGLALERGGRVLDGKRAALRHDVDGRGEVRDVADASSARLPARQREALRGEGRGREGGATEQRSGTPLFVANASGNGRGQGGPDGGREQDGGGSLPGSAGARPSDHWIPCDWLPCRDGKARPVEPGTFPLAHGAPSRVGRLRAYGNAIVPQVAAQFVTAFMDALP
jgi:DNA (cytosine-5)-methyltransferase 1